MGSAVSLVQRNWKVQNPPEAAKLNKGVLRCGILGAARIAPSALILPAKSHPEITIHAVASRDKTKAELFGKKYGIPKVFFGATAYQDMLDDPEIDVVYNPLPNGLHFEWTLKALKAGKHVLLEKPSTNTEEDTRFLFDYAEKKGLVLLEAFHPRFHPCINRIKEIIKSGELGKLKSITCTLWLPWQAAKMMFNDDDIRFKIELGGGALMDMGCYPLAMSRYITDAEPLDVISVQAELFPNPKDDPSKRNIDIGTTALLSFPNDVTASIACHCRQPGWGPFGLLPSIPGVICKAECEGGTVETNNYAGPHMYHYITVVPKGDQGKKRVEKAYTFPDGFGEPWWSTYRYQLEFFVDKVKGRQPRLWMDGNDSTLNMRWIERIYEKTGLGSRPKSDFNLSE
ncbi:NAD-binding protein [Fomitiporia mediterranea MF3/22]|uniref:NAD-binding protein n=1 Tax=Fomitiporia mediterranea (strain MF3/22) TaxID=694068 RepID=UPI0004409BB3|nr:NAD-binding protein [Fomitiporia mediterranea MF3/22]EJD07630.1 NAD-binding protein [Fomitiporia mediterranea MF3/22]